jgi:hypothetical protein
MKGGWQNKTKANAVLDKELWYQIRLSKTLGL